MGDGFISEFLWIKHEIKFGAMQTLWQLFETIEYMLTI